MLKISQGGKFTNEIHVTIRLPRLNVPLWKSGGTIYCILWMKIEWQGWVFNCLFDEAIDWVGWLSVMWFVGCFYRIRCVLRRKQKRKLWDEKGVLCSWKKVLSRKFCRWRDCTENNFQFLASTARTRVLLARYGNNNVLYTGFTRQSIMYTSLLMYTSLVL